MRLLSRGKRFSRAPLSWSFFPFVKSLGVEVSTISSTIGASVVWIRMHFSSISIPYFWICNRVRFSSISVPMTWPRSLMEISSSNIWRQISAKFWSKHLLFCPIPRFNWWLFTQPIYICLGRHRHLSSGWNCGLLKILTVATRLLRKLPKPMAATSLIVMLIWLMIEKSRRLSTPMTASTFMPKLT